MTQPHAPVVSGQPIAVTGGLAGLGAVGTFGLAVLVPPFAPLAVILLLIIHLSLRRAHGGLPSALVAVAAGSVAGGLSYIVLATIAAM